MDTTPLRIKLLGREYVLRADPSDEDFLQEVARFVDEHMRAFRKAHPEQPDLTAAVITAFTIAEEMYRARQDHDGLDGELNRLSRRLESVL